MSVFIRDATVTDGTGMYYDSATTYYATGTSLPGIVSGVDWAIDPAIRPSPRRIAPAPVEPSPLSTERRVRLR